MPPISHMPAMPPAHRARPFELPVIDFAPFLHGDKAARQAVGVSIDRLCRTGGVFYLTNHGIAQDIIARCFQQAQTFFALPLAEKQKIAIANSPCHRGWFNIGEEVLDRQNQPQGDYKEGIKIGRDLSPDHPFVQQNIALHGPNQWPPLPTWQADMQATYDAFSALAAKLMQAIALGLGLSETYFDSWLTQAMATLTPLRYPPISPIAMHETPPSKAGKCQKQSQEQLLSAGAHTDFGCLAILAQDEIAGLQIRVADGTWQTIAPRKHCLLVNIGDMLELWTGGLYRAPQHRVLQTSGQTRHSLAFFYDPQHDTPLHVLPGCPPTQASEQASKPALANPAEPPMTALAYLLKKIDASFAYHRHDS